MRKWCKAAGLEKGCAYGLRHTFGTKQGVCKTNQAVIAQLMGHSSISTTMRYMANNSEAHPQAVNDMEKRAWNWFFPGVRRTELRPLRHEEEWRKIDGKVNRAR